ncbi:hypothetical protein GQ53DRAFT_833892 [Thozetella sp. PMI_491]|nr:hypothetical protein GQ53DRAFT_833892 [Thozetella sp. PMI_491]
MANRAVACSGLGQIEEAQTLLLQTLELRKATLVAVHPDTIDNVANLATMYSNQDRLEEAEALRIEVLEARKASLDPDHPHLLLAMANLAGIYGRRCRLEKARRSGRRYWTDGNGFLDPITR